jgi:hypothetical protein
MSNAMETINTSQCEALRWYQTADERLLCINVDADREAVAFAKKKSGPIGFSVMEMWNCTVTPLPDCTGWDWQPPPKYRPFKDAWEFVEHAKRRDILCDGKPLDLTEIRLEAYRFVLVAKLTNTLTSSWTGLELVEQCTFADTNEPCGVKL